MRGRIKVFYDGACPVCSGLAEKYRAKDSAGRLEFIDITGPGFDPEKYGRTMEQFMAGLNVVDAGGSHRTGLDGLRAIWDGFPAGSRYRLLSRLTGLPLVNSLARAGYRLFVRFRPRKLRP